MSRSCKVLALAIGLGWGVTSAARAEDGPTRERLARVNYLIEMLASKNAAPRIVGEDGEDRTISFPKNYDKSQQVPVYLAMQQLLGEGELALDPLFSHAQG